MKQVFTILILFVVFASCKTSTLQKIAKTNYVETRDTGHEGNAKILKGIINRSVLLNDTAFNWYKDNYKYANPSADAVKAFKERKNKFKILVFGGTWCHDTQNLLPLFYKIIDQSTYAESNVYLLGVDRKKSAGNNLNVEYKIEKVPTFIIIDSKGKEFGRVVEYGETGAIDKELAAIVNKIPS